MPFGVDNIQLDSLTGDPDSPIEGQVWWNSVEQALKLRRSGDTVTLLSVSAHETLRQLIHFVDDGPAQGFVSGAYREIVGGVFPTSVTWYDKEGVGRVKILEKLSTWSGAKRTQVQWNLYDAAEVLCASITDTINYSGVIETSRTRAIT